MLTTEASTVSYLLLHFCFVPPYSAFFASLSMECWTEPARLVTLQVATEIDTYIQGLQNEGPFGCSHRKVPFKWWNHSFGWHHKAQQKMQRHSRSCHLCCILDCLDCQLQLCFQPRKPIEVRILNFAAFFWLCIVLMELL